MLQEIIKLENIFKKYGKKEVLKGLNLTISEGDFISIVGQSGAGKSTLLNILALFEDYDYGSYLFDNKPIKNKEKFLCKFRNEKIGFIFQKYNLIPGLTVEENILLPINYKNNPNYCEVSQRMDELLKFLEIEDLKETNIEYLSGGEQQRIAIARALINNPEIIFADEPTGNLDEQTKVKVIELLKRINKEYKKAIVIVTHDSYVAKETNKCYKLINGILTIEEKDE